MEEIGIKSLAGFLGITAFAVWKVRMHLRTFSIKIFVNDNKAFWAWSIIMVGIVLTIMSVMPDAGDAVKTMVGIDVNGEPTSFLLFGWSLSALAYSMSKKRDEK